MAIILASASPRRRELMAMLGRRDFLLVATSADERFEGWTTPEELVCELACRKAAAASGIARKEDVIVAADTLVFLDDRVLGKPKDHAEAQEMLKALSGRCHRVYTGVCLYKNGEYLTKSEMTEVYFREISPEEILDYIKTGEPMDKAGAYGVQGRAAVFVKGINGDFFNVMGLPLCLLDAMLKEIGQ